MHRSDALRPPVTDDPPALARRIRRRERGEAAKALLAVAVVAIVLGTLAGWQLPL